MCTPCQGESTAKAHAVVPGATPKATFQEQLVFKKQLFFRKALLFQETSWELKLVEDCVREQAAKEPPPTVKAVEDRVHEQSAKEPPPTVKAEED